MNEYDLSSVKPVHVQGYYQYLVPCGGIVTSIEARGFCGRRDNVELRLINGFNDEKGRHSRVILLTAVCDNTTTRANYSEGYVRNDSLNMRILSGGYLSITLNPDCSGEKCYFQPAIINKSSNYPIEYRSEHLVLSSTNVSLLFSAQVSANVTGECSTLVYNVWL